VIYVYHVPLAEMAFSSLPAPATMEGLLLTPADREQLKARLQAFTPADAARTVPIEFVVAEGDIAGEILAQSASADLLVIGTHGRSGYEHMVLGSVAEKLVRKAQCPVLTVPRAAEDATEGVPTLFHQIVAGVDFSPASMHALTFAASLAEEADAHLTVLEVVEIPRELAAWAEESQEGKDRVEQWKALARSRLRTVVPDARRVCCHVDERIETGEPYREILRVAAEQHAGLIVLGAYGHGALGRMFFGSTAQHVVREAVCPVLTFRAPVD
jgi:nucleotide-binding universal stress UspA family protein